MYVWLYVSRRARAWPVLTLSCPAPRSSARVAARPQDLLPVQVHALVASCDRRRAIGRRDFAIITVLSRLGLRAGEAAVLSLDDIDWHSGDLVIRGKGRRDEVLPLPDDVGEAIVAYLRRGRPHCESRQRSEEHTSELQSLMRISY